MVSVQPCCAGTALRALFPVPLGIGVATFESTALVRAPGFCKKKTTKTCGDQLQCHPTFQDYRVVLFESLRVVLKQNERRADL